MLMSFLMKIKQWHVYLVNLNPKAGTKPGKLRPCLAIQPDYFAENDSTVILPLTSQIEENVQDFFPLRIRINAGVAGLISSSDLLMEQILAWDNKKFISELGVLPDFYRDEVKFALKEFLDL